MQTMTHLVGHHGARERGQTGAVLTWPPPRLASPGNGLSLNSYDSPCVESTHIWNTVTSTSG
jgi:hypothetical protein